MSGKLRNNCFIVIFFYKLINFFFPVKDVNMEATYKLFFISTNQHIFSGIFHNCGFWMRSDILLIIMMANQVYGIPLMTLAIFVLIKTKNVFFFYPKLFSIFEVILTFVLLISTNKFTDKFIQTSMILCQKITQKYVCSCLFQYVSILAHLR